MHLVELTVAKDLQMCRSMDVIFCILQIALSSNMSYRNFTLSHIFISLCLIKHRDKFFFTF
jgi:hypothetical protein